MKTSYKKYGSKDSFKIFLTGTARYWRFQVKAGERIIAQECGNFERDVSDAYALQFASIRAELWLEERSTRLRPRQARFNQREKGAAV
jgi:hypothetical protein